MDEYLNKLVLIRDHMAGILVGTLVGGDLVSGTWTLKNARKVHYWTRAAAAEGLAVTGDMGSGGRITPMVPLVSGRSLVQIIEDYGGCQKILEAPVWTP